MNISMVTVQSTRYSTMTRAFSVSKQAWLKVAFSRWLLWRILRLLRLDNLRRKEEKFDQKQTEEGSGDWSGRLWRLPGEHMLWKGAAAAWSMRNHMASNLWPYYKANYKVSGDWSSRLWRLPGEHILWKVTGIKSLTLLNQTLIRATVYCGYQVS